MLKSVSFQMKRYSVFNDTLSPELAFLPLLAYGCDGILNSGKRNFSCGCDDDKSCYDCNGTLNGGK